VLTPKLFYSIVLEMLRIYAKKYMTLVLQPFRVFVCCMEMAKVRGSLAQNITNTGNMG